MSTDQEKRHVVAEVNTKASLYADGRMSIISEIPLDDLMRERIALEIARAYIVGHLHGIEHAWHALANKQ